MLSGHFIALIILLLTILFIVVRRIIRDIVTIKDGDKLMYLKRGDRMAIYVITAWDILYIFIFLIALYLLLKYGIPE